MKKLVLTTVCALAMGGAAFAQGNIQWLLPTTAVTFQTNTAASPLFGGSGNGGVVGLTGNATSAGYTGIASGDYDYILLSSAWTGTPTTDTAVWDGTWSGNTANGGGQLTATNSGSGPGSLGRANANGGGTSVAVNWASGTTQNVVVVGWSTNLGMTWAGVSNILLALSEHNTAPLTAALLASGNANGEAFFGETAFGWITPNAGTPGLAITQTTGTPGASGLGIFSLNTSLYLLPVPEPATLALAGLGGLSLLLFRRQRK